MTIARDRKPIASIPLLLNGVLAELNMLSAKELTRLGLTPQSARALLVLLHYSQMRCSSMARLLGLEATALSHLLRALARKQLIIRNRVENDNRAVEVRLSEKGRRVAQACNAATGAYERKLLTGLDTNELELLQRILTKMRDNIEPLRRSRRSLPPGEGADEGRAPGRQRAKKATRAGAAR
jgi:MarR family transcriptional regulator, organic hydroperoxide resistance regulator